MTHYQVCPEVQIVENENIEPGQEYFISKGTRSFYVSSAIAELIKIIRSGANINMILTKMAEKHQLAEQQVFALLNDKLPKLGLLIDSTQQEQKSKEIDQYIKLSIPVLSEKFILRTSKTFQHLYNVKAAVLCITLFLAAFTALFMGEKFTFLTLESLTLFPLIFSVEDYIWLYFILLFSYITHELGHASASYRYGIPVKKVGMGLYFIFPVFFADISKAWGLSVNKRTVINLGGIYFQLLYLAGVALYASYTDSHIATYAIYVILNSIIISLSPFLRFDGYWIYSDVFKLPNLRNQSKQLIADVLFNEKSTITNRLLHARKQQPALFYYSLTSLMFLFFIGNILFTVGISMIESAPYLYQEIKTQFTQSQSFSSYSFTGFRSAYYILLVTAYSLLIHRLIKAFVTFFSRPTEEK